MKINTQRDDNASDKQLGTALLHLSALQPANEQCAVARETANQNPQQSD